jgi:hypothetical protein
MSYFLHGHHTGGKPTRTMKSWLSMKQRCFNPNVPDFSRYGGQGITVCERWRNSFANFLADMGERPQGMTLDRIDNEGDYTPENCRWATESAQQRNTSVSIYLTINGETRSIMEWAKIAVVHVGTMRRRFHAGWAHEDIVFRPSRQGGEA